MQFTPQTAFSGIIFFSVQIAACPLCMADSPAVREIEVFVMGKRYCSVEDYLNARKKEKLQAVVLSEPVPSAPVSVKPFVEELPQERVERFVAGIGSFQQELSAVKTARKVSSVREMNAGLTAAAEKTSAPLLILAEGGRVRVLELTRKEDLLNHKDKQPDVFVQGK